MEKVPTTRGVQEGLAKICNSYTVRKWEINYKRTEPEYEIRPSSQILHVFRDCKSISNYLYLWPSKVTFQHNCNYWQEEQKQEKEVLASPSILLAGDLDLLSENAEF